MYVLAFFREIADPSCVEFISDIVRDQNNMRNLGLAGFWMELRNLLLALRDQSCADVLLKDIPLRS